MNEGWTFKILSKNKAEIPDDIILSGISFPADVPGTIHTDLLNAGLIDDPFFSDNEKRLQWIAECDWQYETFFNLPADFTLGAHTNLVFEGLDTAAEIYLNEQKIGAVRNMFVRYTFDLQDLKPAMNHLLIKFHSPLKYVRGHKMPIKQFPSARHPDRVFLRKSQYSFGWDWGPAFPTCGIWRPAYLEQPDYASIDLKYFEAAEIKENSASVIVKTAVHKDTSVPLTLSVMLANKKHKFSADQTLTDSGSCNFTISIDDPDLWQPHTEGLPNLYNLELEIKDPNDRILDRIKKRVGIRTVSLDLGTEGKKAFRFSVNNKPVYLKGANWIPADSFLPRVSKDKYKDLITAARNANMNVLRVWGGGIYEDDYFYELCDELGILVWQDYMFACAAYPEHKEFIAEFNTEAEQNIRRLHHHPSIAVWCGNNENEWIWYRDECGKTEDMPGFGTCHRFLPELLKDLDPSRPYWPTTPFGNETDPNSEESGNRHSWDIWSRWVDYCEVKSDNSLFVSEFGFQGPADYHTLKDNIPATYWHPQSRIFEFHNKQDEGNERLFRFLSAHLPVKTDLQDFIYLTQLNQGFALKTCLEHWRLRWPETAGSIIWQLNDCWPVTSWALIDSELKFKLAYYFTQRAFADWLPAFREDEDEVKLVFQNSGKEKFSGRIELKALDLITGKLNDIKALTLAAGDIEEKTDLYTLPAKRDEQQIYLASLYDEKGGLRGRNYFLDGRWKHKIFGRQLNVDLNLKLDKGRLIISSAGPAFFVTLQHPQLTFSDNGFIILPDEEKMVEIYGGFPADFNVSDIKIFSLNQYLI